MVRSNFLSSMPIALRLNRQLAFSRFIIVDKDDDLWRSLLVVDCDSVGESYLEEVVLPRLRPDGHHSLVSLKSEAEVGSSDNLGGEGNQLAQSEDLLSGEGLSALALLT